MHFDPKLLLRPVKYSLREYRRLRQLRPMGVIIGIGGVCFPIAFSLYYLACSDSTYIITMQQPTVKFHDMEAIKPKKEA